MNKSKENARHFIAHHVGDRAGLQALLIGFAFITCLAGSVSAQTTINIGPQGVNAPPSPPYGLTNAFGNYVQVTNVTYSLNGGAPFTPGNAGAPPGFNNPSFFNSATGEFISTDTNRITLTTSQSLVVNSVTVDTNGAAPGGELVLKRFASQGVTVANFNYPLNVPWSDLQNIYASDNGTRTDIAIQNPNGPPHTQNPAWITAASQVLGSGDLNDLLAHDSGGALGPYDYDVRFTTPLTLDDFVLVAERSGNTYFDLTPLDASYNPITNANTLRFGGPDFPGPAHTRYEFRTGVIPAGSAGQNQDQALGVADVSLFFDSTLGGPGTAPPQLVYGFRVNNDGQADVQFFGLSPVPEAGTIVAAVGVGFLFLVGIVRRRIARGRAAAC